MPKKFPKKPFKYGRYLIEYRKERDGILRFLKERLDTIEEAEQARERLVLKGYHEPLIKIVG
tara:strand:- start:1927 stop:2112 length:186 start_codon:yes stop_codon:yes gene_type:complete